MTRENKKKNNTNSTYGISIRKCTWFQECCPFLFFVCLSLFKPQFHQNKLRKGNLISKVQFIDEIFVCISLFFSFFFFSLLLELTLLPHPQNKLTETIDHSRLNKNQQNSIEIDFIRLLEIHYFMQHSIPSMFVTNCHLHSIFTIQIQSV